MHYIYKVCSYRHARQITLPNTYHCLNRFLNPVCRDDPGEPCDSTVNADMAAKFQRCIDVACHVSVIPPALLCTCLSKDYMEAPTSFVIYF